MLPRLTAPMATALWEAADHDGVDDAHGHPAEFGEHQGPGQGQHGTPLAADVFEGGHIFRITYAGGGVDKRRRAIGWRKSFAATPRARTLLDDWRVWGRLDG